mgnify:CR=1 FL=1
MEANKYPATGSLFTQKEKRSEKSPDYSGKLTLEMEVLDDLANIERDRQEQNQSYQKPVQQVQQTNNSNNITDDEIPF